MERKNLNDYELDPIEKEPFVRGWYGYLYCCMKEKYDGPEGDREAWEKGWIAAQSYCMYPQNIKAV